MRDPYTVLGVAKTASADDIKKSYRKLARTLHPDLNPGDKKAEERFKEVSAAYDLLSDPVKKGKYDRGEIDASGAEKRTYRSHAGAGRAGAGGPGGRFRDFDFGGFDADDILSDIFGRRGGGAAGGAGGGFGFGGARGPLKGADQHFSLKVAFAEAALGTTKRITLQMGKSLDVRIPPGTEDGQTLRLKGQGAPGTNGGPAGDALIEIGVEPHPYFTRQGKDLHLELPVTLAEAALGAKVTVPTLDGRVAVTVPPGSNSGTTMRLKGKGIGDAKGQHRGDQYVKLMVMLPDHVDPDLQKFLKDWAAKHPYDVRSKLG